MVGDKRMPKYAKVAIITMAILALPWFVSFGMVLTG